MPPRVPALVLPPVTLDNLPETTPESGRPTTLAMNNVTNSIGRGTMLRWLSLKLAEGQRAAENAALESLVVKTQAEKEDEEAQVGPCVAFAVLPHLFPCQSLIIPGCTRNHLIWLPSSFKP
jgi:hypothetical protein